MSPNSAALKDDAGPAASGAPFSHPAGRTLRTLAVEDCGFDQKRLLRLARKTRFALDFKLISRIEDLRAALDQDRFDLVILDYQLPSGTGIDAARIVRAHPGHLTAAIVMLTGRSDTDVAVAAMRCGCSDFLDKSRLTAKALEATISNAMDGALTARELMRARGLNDKISAFLKGFAEQSVGDMKPALLQIMRLNRAAMARAAIKGQPEAREMDEACRALWRVFSALESVSRQGHETPPEV